MAFSLLSTAKQKLLNPQETARELPLENDERDLSVGLGADRDSPS